MTQHATRIATAHHAVTVLSQTNTVTDWMIRYFGQWWNAEPATAPFSGPLVTADVNATTVTTYTQNVSNRPHQETTYANTRMLYGRTSGHVVTAAQPSEHLAYRSEPGHLHIVGHETLPVCLAAARLAREVVRGQLLADGWSILHASAATDPDGQTVLTLGGKGSGKTTTALLLARAGWRLLANDRVFVRPDSDGIRVLPWPSAAAIGLGLLDALATDRRKPLWNENGKELKPQLFPHQLSEWLGLSLATEGRAAHLLFPHITPATTPAKTDDSRAPSAEDFFTAATEDRYADVFELLPSEQLIPKRALDLLSHLPHHSITLSHDVKDNTAFLTELLAAP
ncbi:hypothetical protein [Streptomyces aureoverticillatus]|uniref:hypothetical protein n=1 Tax=Streptomyces aureoverticillatus TaxID=66871 RepID=UPI0013DBB5F6|nr:hypothetical protein [Streptomyces aureoverticillatus]QIB47592.1 hypothetical protein G3H79_35465 [Streptomyces aureoverticillatus]